MELVTVDNFTRAESDRYFADAVRLRGLGTVHHGREPTPVDEQNVIRMNRDTLYSSGVFDLEAAPVTVTLPDAAGRFMSLMAISQDHYTHGCVYDAGPHTFTARSVGTRYASIIVRTFVDPDDPIDVAEVHRLQDATVFDQPARGAFEIPEWDPLSLSAVRDTILRLAPRITRSPGRSFGTREEVDPIDHLIVTAGGWGGNVRRDADYRGVYPEHNDGTTAYRLTVGEVPVDGFWSVSVYDADGFFAPNPEQSYSVNNVTATRDPDGSVTISLGGPDGPNHIPIVPGWNYVVRLYRPRAEILDGSWTFPAAVPVSKT